jgi:EAL and modified HD-GYP domain-containing signal transduction protein
MTPIDTTAPAEHDQGLVLLARQPIYSRDNTLFGYELLQRTVAGEAWDADDDVVTMKVIRKAVFDFGFNALAGKGRVFLNVGPRGLIEEHYLPFPAERTVLEVLERVEPDDEILEAVQRARAAGYSMALDDYTGDARFDALLPYVDIVKLDLMAMERDTYREVFAHLTRVAPRARVLAEKVETEQDLVDLRSFPVALFQGYYFKKPTVLEAQTSNPNQTALLRLASTLSSDDVDFDRLAALTSTVPKLAFDLLRITNSAATSLNRTVTSLHEAIIALGIKQLRRLVHILLATSNPDAPAELGTLGLVRARLCANLAARDRHDTEAAFTVGLFSIMDLVLRRPLADILADIDLHEDITAALLHHRGVLATYLDAAIAAEGKSAPAGSTAVAPSDITLEAIAWAERLTSDLGR